MRRLCFALLLLLVFPVAGSCTRQEPAPAVTVVFFGQGTPVSYECDEVALMGQLSDGRMPRCPTRSQWGLSLFWSWGPSPAASVHRTDWDGTTTSIPRRYAIDLFILSQLRIH